MKKALDYVSDYQLKSACKDAICIAPSKISDYPNDFCCFRGLISSHRSHSCKLVSFVTYIRCKGDIVVVRCECQKNFAV